MAFQKSGATKRQISEWDREEPLLPAFHSAHGHVYVHLMF